MNGIRTIQKENAVGPDASPFHADGSEQTRAVAWRAAAADWSHWIWMRFDRPPPQVEGGQAAMARGGGRGGPCCASRQTCDSNSVTSTLTRPEPVALAVGCWAAACASFVSLEDLNAARPRQTEVGQRSLFR